MFGRRRNVMAVRPNPWKVPNPEARESVKRQSRGGFLIGVLSSAALVATLVGITSSASAANTANWKLGYYTPSPHGTISTSSVTGPAPALATFNFTNLPNTALLITDQGANKSMLLGDDTGMTVSAKFTVSNLGAGASFMYFGQPDACGGTTSYVRYFFQTNNAGGFDETHFWWSNPVSAALVTNGSPTLASVSLDGSNWSDFFGHFGNDPAYADGFKAAVSDVTSIGLSFGGGCFFENGVGTTDGSGTFTLNSYTLAP
jgi:hypothetical protein